MELLPDGPGANDDDPLGVGDPLPELELLPDGLGANDDPLGVGDPELPELELLPDGLGANDDDPLGEVELPNWNCFRWARSE